jgi:transcriptional antiterminator RfaH
MSSMPNNLKDPLPEQKPGPAWYAIRTKPNREQLARQNYLHQSFCVYLPLLQTTRRHARRTEKVLRPVFPGYLFLHLAPNERNWPVISSTRGALGPVSFGKEFIPVPDWVISTLRAKENEQGLFTPGTLEKDKLRPGCPIEVTLDGGGTAQGLFCSFSGKDNVEILLDILRRQVRTTTSLDRIKNLGSP